MIATPTSNSQKTLYVCKSNLDALQIKNAIQRIAPIGVVIDKTGEQIRILVDESSFKTANLILQNNISNLSKVKQIYKIDKTKMDEPEVEVPLKIVARKNVFKMAANFFENHLNLNNKGALEGSIVS